MIFVFFRYKIYNYVGVKMSKKNILLIVMSIILFIILAIAINADILSGFESWVYFESVEHMSDILTNILIFICNLFLLYDKQFTFTSNDCLIIELAFSFKREKVNIVVHKAIHILVFNFVYYVIGG